MWVLQLTVFVLTVSMVLVLGMRLYDNWKFKR